MPMNDNTFALLVFLHILGRIQKMRKISRSYTIVGCTLQRKSDLYSSETNRHIEGSGIHLDSQWQDANLFLLKH